MERCSFLFFESHHRESIIASQLFANFENFLTDGVGMHAPTDRSMIGIRQGTNQ
jgi:hypothetical protein